MAYVIGDSVLRSNIEITATGDTAAIHYTEGNPVPKIGVIRKQDANVAIQTANENNQQIKDYRERCIDLSKNVLGLNSRTRAVGSNKHYDGIDNLEPIGKTIPKETELNTFLKQ
jgi:NADH dehydrogenase FAD-containing subunit